MKRLRHALPLIVGMLLHSSVSAEVVPLPPAAQKLRKDYLASIEIVEAPIRERYLADLTKLCDQAVKAGKLDEALALRTEMNNTMVQPMLGRWTDPLGRGFMDLRKDGTVAHTNGSTGHWELRGEVLCVAWNNGWKHEFPLAKPGPILRGHVIDPAGDKTPFSESRPRDK